MSHERQCDRCRFVVQHCVLRVHTLPQLKSGVMIARNLSQISHIHAGYQFCPYYSENGDVSECYSVQMVRHRSQAMERHPPQQRQKRHGLKLSGRSSNQIRFFVTFLANLSSREGLVGHAP